MCDKCGHEGCGPAPEPTSAFLTLGVVRPKPVQGIILTGAPLMALQILDSQQLPVTAAATDSEGNPAGGTWAYSSSDETIVGVTDNNDGSALLVASPGDGGLGDATVSAVFTNADGTTLTATLEITVVAGDATVANIVPGAPEDKPVA